MRRDPTPYLVVLLLTVLGAVAYLTRHPEHPVVDRLAGLPVIGPAAEWFRDTYRPAPPPAREEVGSEPETIVVDEAAPRREVVELVISEPLGGVWVRAGTGLRATPDDSSAVVEIAPHIAKMVLRERRGEWRRVSRSELGGRLVEGWVRAGELAEPSPDELWEAAPVVPLAAFEIEEGVLAEAREAMGDAARALPCGPFRLFTDVAGPVVDSCPRLAGQLDRIYAARTGLEPVGEARETILLFDAQGAYLIFRTRISPESRRDAFASPGRGFLAMAVGGKEPGHVRAMLVHELVHLLNRRFLGPALPSWIDEGLAEELGMSRIAADGTLEPGTVGGFTGGDETMVVLGGGRMHLIAVRATMRRGELPTLEELVALDRAAFQAEDRFQLHYSLSAFWVRYLLSGQPPRSSEGFRAFLAAVASGERLEGELLLARLGAGWRELEAGFRRWLGSDAAAGAA